MAPQIKFEPIEEETKIDFTPIDFEPIDSNPPTTPTPKVQDSPKPASQFSQPTLMQRFLNPYAGIENAPTGMVAGELPILAEPFKWLADKIDPPLGEGGYLRGLAAGALEGIGNLATTPFGGPGKGSAKIAEVLPPETIKSSMRLTAGPSNLYSPHNPQLLLPESTSRTFMAGGRNAGAIEVYPNPIDVNPAIGYETYKGTGKALRDASGKMKPRYYAGEGTARPDIETIPSAFKNVRPTSDTRLPNQTQFESIPRDARIKDIIEGKTPRTINERVLNQVNIDQAKPSLFKNVVNFPRAMQSSLDLSALLRQGMGLIHKKEYWTSLDDMFRAFGSEKAYQQIMSNIETSPTFALKKQSGLQLTDLINKREESLVSTLAEKFPGVRRSNRAYTAFLNQLRSDAFDNLIKAAPKDNPVIANDIARFINNATGRGTLGSLEKHAELLNNVLYSPRLIASRVNTLNPLYYKSLDPFVRKEAIKSLLAMAGSTTTFASLAALAGANVSLDSTSSDFGKVRIGDTRIDPYAGYQQYIVMLNRLVQGERNGQQLGEKFGSPTRKDVVMDFAANKLNPIMKFAYDWMNSSEYRKFNIPEETIKLVTPLMAQDIVEVYQENPELLPITVPTSLFGMGVQSYPDRR